MADIQVGMKVNGVSSFVSAMKQSQASMKQFDAELKLAEAEFEANGNAQQKMAKQTTTLKKKIEEQKKAVEECKKALEQMEKNGVEKNSAAWKSWETALTNNQAALVGTQNKLNNLKGSVGNISAQVKSGTKATGEYSASLKNIQNITDFKAVADGIGSITNAVTSAIAGVINLGKKLWNLEAEQTYWADDLLTRATTYGMDAEELQRWEYASRFVDTEASTIMAARNKLMKQYKNEFSGTLQIFDGWDGYISLRQSNGEMRDSTDIFWDALSALGRMTNETERDTRAQELFGQSWAELLPLLTKGREEWERLGAEAPIISNEEVNKLGEANDSLQELEAKFENLQHQIAAGFAPAFTSVANSLSDVFDRVSAWVSTPEGQAVIQSFSDAIVTMLDSLTDEDFQSVAETVQGVLNGIVSALGWIVDNKDGVKTSLEVIGVALAGLKIAQATLTGLQLLSGFKGLTGGTGTNTTGIPAGGVPPTTPTTPTSGSNAGDSPYVTTYNGLGMTTIIPFQQFYNQAKNALENSNLGEFVRPSNEDNPYIGMYVRSLKNKSRNAVKYATDYADLQTLFVQNPNRTNGQEKPFDVPFLNIFNDGVDIKDMIEQYKGIGEGAASGIYNGFSEASSTFDAAGAAAAYALTRGFNAGISGDSTGGSTTTTGNVYIGQITNSSMASNVVQQVKESLNRSLAGYGGGR